MKIKISYTIDDSEIPNEIAKFLDKVDGELTHKARETKETSENIKNNFDVNEIENYWSQIDTIRQEMVKVDTIMSDCQDILVGLSNIVEQRKQEASKAEDSQLISDPFPAVVSAGDEDSSE